MSDPAAYDGLIRYKNVSDPAETAVFVPLGSEVRTTYRVHGGHVVLRRIVTNYREWIKSPESAEPGWDVTIHGHGCRTVVATRLDDAPMESDRE